MANRSEAAQALFSNSEYNQQVERQATHWGGEVGKQVQDVSAEQEVEIHQVLDFYYTHLREKYSTDPESLTDAELAAARVAQYEGNYSPRQQAEIYSTMEVMYKQMSDPESDFSKQKKIYERDERGRWKLSADGEQMVAGVNRQRIQIFENLTGIDPVAAGNFKEKDRFARAKEAGSRFEAVSIALTGRGRGGKSVEEMNEDEFNAARMKGFQDERGRLTVQARIDTISAQNLESQKTSALEKMTEIIGRYPTGRSTERVRRVLDVLEMDIAMAQTERELAEIIRKANTPELTEVVNTAEYVKNPEQVILEDLLAEDLDRMVARAKAGEVSQNPEQIMQTIAELDREIANEGNDDRRRDLERQRAFAKDAYSLVEGDVASKVLQLETRNVENITNLMGSLDEADVVAGLEEELDIEVPAGTTLDDRIKALDRRLSRRSKSSLLSSVASMLNKGAKKRSRKPSRPRNVGASTAGRRRP
ncbi:hypothetical protein HGA91_00810 [candidate division WWE3 bacterium]|nr:hypothetical protein [candidate division WWE3 bacterium]